MGSSVGAITSTVTQGGSDMSKGYESSEANPSRKRIFVVDGSWEFLEVLKEFLTLEEYEVTAALTVPDTFERIRAWRPDLIVVDLVVFEQAGWDLLEQIHLEAQTNMIPVIVISTSYDLLEDAKRQVDRYGGDYYLAKPFRLEELLEKVHHAIDTSVQAP
jgi:CheY-like chemotaxis protein